MTPIGTLLCVGMLSLSAAVLGTATVVTAVYGVPGETTLLPRPRVTPAIARVERMPVTTVL